MGTQEIEVGRLQEAFETVERAKSRSLLDALAREPAAPVQSETEASLLAAMEQVKQELNWYYNRLNQPDSQSPAAPAEWAEEVSQRERRLGQLLKRWRSPDLIQAPGNPIWTVTVAQLQAVLPPDTMLLEYYTAGQRVLVFGLTAGELWSYELPVSAEAIGGYLGAFRFQLNKFAYGPAYRQRHAATLKRSAEDSLGKLYGALIEPIRPKLTAANLIIVPHSLLHYIPFQALFDGARYLLDEKTVSYAPSATILYRMLTSQAVEATGEPLVLGVADEAIPWARAEAMAIGDLFPAADLRLDGRATLDDFKVNGRPPAFVHLATHATFRADNPLFSAVKLADRWLSVNDIYSLDARVPLITLSACDTGQNQVAAGDELVGLCRGFLAAGARSLVVSLWPVDDQSTAGLMSHFYQGLQAGLPVNQALHNAQLATKIEMEHPYYWAAFVLTGNMATRINVLAGAARR